MNRAKKSLIGIASGVLLTVASLFGWFGGVSVFAAGLGLLAAIISAGFLLSSQSLQAVRRPHLSIWALLAFAAGLHFYEHALQGLHLFSAGWFIWALAPHTLALILSCFGSTRMPAVAGAALALLMDAITFYGVFVAPTSSTAPLALIWTPLWNLLIVVPVATWVVWRITHRRMVGTQAS